ARRKRLDPLRAGRLEMVDGAGAELHRERDCTGLGELISVEPERKAGVAAGLEIAPRLCGVECSALEEHVRRFRELGRLRQDLSESEIEVGVGVAELRRDRVGPEPRRDAARLADRAQRRELRLAVEAIARLRLER